MPWVLTRGERRRRNRLQGGRLHLGTVAGIKSEWWPTSSRNRWPACVGIRIVCALRRATGFPLDDLTFVVTPFLPHLNRDAVYRILKAEGLGRLPPADRARRLHSRFKEYDR